MVFDILSYRRLSVNFIDLIARSNYLEVLQSGKSSELETYLNNIRRLKGLFISLGATEDIMAPST